MKRIILNLDSAGNVIDDLGAHIGILTNDAKEAKSIAAVTIELVKLGVAPDEIIKLKNQGLL